MQPTPELFRRAWRTFPTGVSVVTTRTSDGAPYATTANALLSVSIDPMLLLLSVTTAGHTCLNLSRHGLFAVNFLRDDQEAIADFYGRAPPLERRRLPAAHTVHESGLALLDDAVAWMICRVRQRTRAGDHTLFVAAVEDIDVRDGDALVFYRGRYGSAQPG